jgi:hypothetical protein
VQNPINSKILNKNTTVVGKCQPYDLHFCCHVPHVISNENKLNFIN